MEAKAPPMYSRVAEGPAIKDVSPEPTPAKPGYYLVQKDDVNQSSISMVGVGIQAR